ncbi:YbjQ family protein [Nocardia sp. NPDC052001]|uniref:YbjQ family protein n=1 Tax=Nocardia sp. NPDC052001 TaxID=3154853 RepID=UPI003444B996
MSVNEDHTTGRIGTDHVIVSTMNDLPGYQVTEVLGDVFGLTVRSRHLGSQLGAGLKSMFGGELKGMTKMLSDSREEARQRLVEHALELGADAVLAMRFDANDFADIGQEICAYGTAVRIRADKL